MKQGFTLFEFLFVMGIIVMLAAIALPQYRIAVERARTAEALSNGRSLTDSMNRSLLLSPNTPPDSREMLDVNINNGKWVSNTQCNTNDFSYDISNGSFLEIVRDNDGTELYRLRLYNRYVPADDGKLECLWSTSLGKKICTLLERSGYTVQQL